MSADAATVDGDASETVAERDEADELGFVEVEYPEPHQGRTKELLQRHPEIKEYFETNPWTAVICVAVVGAQLGLAVWVSTQPWWVLLLAAYFVGAFLDNATYAIIHEASHKRVFRGRLWNEVVGWIANLPELLPTSSSFKKYHLKHHLYQGDPEYDADLATPEEAEWVGRSTIRKVVWQLFYPLFQSLRTRKFEENETIEFWDRWVVTNAIIQFGFLGLFYYLAGGWALLYLLLSFSFSMGLHPLSARLIQEHFIIEDDQETYSYYGPMNKLALNVYHHNEHHDFPAVPWNNLPKVREIASEVYEDELHYHESLTSLWLKFLFDPSMTLYNRIIRDYYGGTVER
ncbi:MAG: fatty acid desaturase [Bradymonadaceae bacterium]